MSKSWSEQIKNLKSNSNINIKVYENALMKIIEIAKIDGSCKELDECYIIAMNALKKGR